MKENHKDYLITKLRGYSKNKIIISDHARIRAVQRQLEVDEIIENIINPKRLEYAIKEELASANEEKFDCYFGYSKTQCHRYIVVINHIIVVVTAIKINRRWQKIVESRMRE